MPPLVRSPEIIQQLAEERLHAFQHDLATDLKPIGLYRKFIMEPDPCVLTGDGMARLESIFRHQWGLGEGSLRLVGSAALGFSLKPKRRFCLFEDEISDLDVAIVDRDFFEDMWQEVHEYARARFWDRQPKFAEYLYDGWIRPDIMPGTLGNTWFDFFHSIRQQQVFRRIKVRAALYPSDYFLEQYQCHSIEGCR